MNTLRTAALALVAGGLVLGTAGCTSLLLWNKPEAKSLEELASEESRHLVGRYAHPFGMDYVKVEAVALVTGLNGTGEDPPPTPQRAALLAEMKRRQVENASAILASPDTALVLVMGLLRPGIQEGDHFDVEVRVPSRSGTTSLRGGWLMPTRLTDVAVLGEQLRRGHVLGVAEGAVLVDPNSGGDTDVAAATRGRVLGGGVAAKSRPMGLMIDGQHKSFRLSTQIGKSINDRFSTYSKGRKQGVAVPKTDEVIEILVHERYRDNVSRYMRVVRAIAVNETTAARQERLLLLGKQILNPMTASGAAIELEAIGNAEAVDMLLTALNSPNREVQFYAAEALAYLDETEAVPILRDIAAAEPAFRVNSMAALSAMNDVLAYDALRSLLESTSAETRYGAFRALWAMNSKDPFITGEQLGEKFGYHVLDVGGPTMIHATNSYRPEIVLFGRTQMLKTPLMLEAGTRILVNGMQGDRITVSRFTQGGETVQREISTSVDDLIRTIVELGGDYPDVVQVLQQAKEQGALESRFKVDALPESGRQFTGDQDETEDAAAEPQRVVSPLPDLFKQRGS